MLNDTKKLAILITTYNGSSTIKKTIRAIKDCISLYQGIVKLYIYDDNSTDNTIEIILANWNPDLDHPIIIKNKENLGLFQNKNKALSILSKEYKWVLLMHQDDFPYPNWINCIVNTINECKVDNIFTIWSNYNISYDNNLVLDLKPDSQDKFKIISPNKDIICHYIKNIYTPYCISGSAINLELAKSINFFNDYYSHFGDTAFIVDGLLNGFSHIYISTPLIVRTMNDLQASSRHKRESRDTIEFIIFYKAYSKYLPVWIKLSFGLTLLNITLKRILRTLTQMKFNKLFLNLGIAFTLIYLILKAIFKRI